MAKPFDLADFIMNFDPEAPQERFREMGIKGAMLPARSLLPDSPPWPKNKAPTPAPLPVAPGEDEDLTRFKGYDAVIMTWTVAEAATLARLMTPGYKLADWYEYRHEVDDYIPLVTGWRAPFNSKQSERYYHSLGLYFPCRVGKARVLLFKSGLHLDYDGPQTPLGRLVPDIISEVSPRVFITTGTAGGIGPDVALGDVVIGGVTRFHCTTQFKKKPWCSESYPASALPSRVLKAIQPKLTGVNAARVVEGGGRPAPKIFSSATDAIVTTDFFGFDDSTNHYRLQGLGRACEMGDAMVAQVLRQYPDVAWYAIRNASDPQIPNPDGDIGKAGEEAGQIYSKYGALTTAASVIASWAVAASLYP